MSRLNEIENELFNLKEDQEKLLNEINGLTVDRLPWCKYDMIAAVSAGAIGIAIDLISKLNVTEVTAKKIIDPFKNFDLKNNPIDKNLPGASLGDHRIYSQGHDLVRFFETAHKMMTGGATNYYTEGGSMFVKAAPDWQQLNYSDAMAVLAVHLIKDVFTARSLPIPGTSIITDVNNGKVPDFLVNGYNSNDLNLKNISGAVIATAVPTVVSRVYTSLMYKNINLELRRQKSIEIEALAQLMIVAASTAHAGTTNNPLKINYSSLLRLCINGIQLIDGHSQRSNNSKLNGDLRLSHLDLEQRRTQLALEVMHYILDDGDQKLNFGRRSA